MKFPVAVGVIALICQLDALKSVANFRSRLQTRMLASSRDSNPRLTQKPAPFICAIALCSALLSGTPVGALSLEAGKLYEQASTTIDTALIQYKDTEGDWKGVSKQITENSKIIQNACNSLKSLTKDATTLQTALKQIVAADVSEKDAINAENEQLREATAAKYEAAEASAAALARPGATANLFKAAQNEVRP
jgi:septal ring factor EnvC (AmiA/AmiB activator)